jgi:hypothetical protein
MGGATSVQENSKAEASRKLLEEFRVAVIEAAASLAPPEGVFDKDGCHLANPRDKGDKRLKSVFDQFDTNHDGVLDCNELDNLIQRLDFHVSEQLKAELRSNMRNLFLSFADPSFHLDFNEFYQFIKPSHVNGSGDEGGLIMEKFHWFGETSGKEVVCREMSGAGVELGREGGVCRTVNDVSSGEGGCRTVSDGSGGGDGGCRPAGRKLVLNEPKRIIFVGATGSGKSSLCTVLTGQDKTASSFKIANKASSETSEVKMGKFHWFGDKNEEEFLCIDTPGLDDELGRDDEYTNNIIQEMQKLEYINSIILVINGQNPRISTSVQHMIIRFEKSFSQRFYEHLLFV